MGVDVAWVDERHEQKEFVSDNAQWMTKLTTTRWPKLSGSVCLRFVEAWSDAVFNQAQIPELISELRNEIAAATHAGTRAHLEKVLRLVEKAEGQTHTYIKFIGD